MLPPVTFVVATRYHCRFKSGMRLFLSKHSLRHTQSAFLLSLSLPLSFSSSSHFLLSPSRKNIKNKYYSTGIGYHSSQTAILVQYFWASEHSIEKGNVCSTGLHCRVTVNTEYSVCIKGGLQLPNFSENLNNVQKWVGGVNACLDWKCPALDNFE